MFKKIIFVFALLFANIFSQQTNNSNTLTELQVASEPDYPPYCFVNEKGEADGFSVELFKAAIKAVDLKADIKVGVWNHIKEDLTNGEIDALPHVGRTPEREDFYDFTMPFLSLHGAIFVNEDTDDIKSVQDLKSKSIVVMKGDNSEEFILRENLTDNLSTVNTFSEAFLLLSNGECDAVITQRILGLKLIEELKIDNVIELPVFLTGFRQDFCFAVKKGNKTLLNKLNEGLSIIIANKKYEEIREKYFGPRFESEIALKDILIIILYVLIPAIVLGSIIFIFVLKKEVTRQTNELAKEIDERKKAQEELKASEEKFRRLTENAKDMIYRMSLPDGKYEYVSPACEKIWGYKPEEFYQIPLIIRETLLPKWQDYFSEQWENLLNGIMPPSYEYQIKHKNGKIKWLNQRNVLVKDENNTPIAIEGIVTDVTTQKNMEVELRESEQRFKALHNASFSGIIIHENGKIIECNQELSELTGYTYNEFVGMDLLSLFADSSKEKVKNNIFERFEQPYEAIAVKKDGTEFYARIEGKNIPYKGRRVRVTEFRDITEAKKIEEQLTDSYNLLDASEEIAKTGGWEVDLKTQELLWTDGVREIHEVEKDYQPNLEEALKFYSDESTPIIENAVKNAIKYGKEFDLELQISTAKNNKIWIHTIGKTIFRDGKPVKMLGAIQNIDARKKSESKIKRYDDIVKNMLIGLFVYQLEDLNDDKTLKIISANPSSEEILGLKLEPLIGKYIDEVFPNLRVQSIPQKYAEVVRTQIPIQLDDFKYSDNRIKEKYFSVRAFPLPEQCVGIEFENVTDRKIAELSLIENQRLSAIGEISSAIAHDFNNSLQAILGNVELLFFDKMLTNKTKETLHLVKTAAHDAAQRVQLLQKFNSNQNINESYKTINISNMIKDVILQTRPLWKDEKEREGIQILIETDLITDVKINGNEGEIRSVVFNLIKNSVEAMPDGGIITINTEIKNNNVIIYFNDNGCGMDESIKSRVFQPFFSTKGFQLGRGLGLSGAFGIIVDHGGKINLVESFPGVGTTISIELPISMQEDEKEKIVENNLEDNLNYKTKFLWVDDEKMIRDSGKSLLEKLGFDAEVAASGEEALDKIKESKYDVVVTDIGMPGMNGWELSKKISAEYDGKMKIALLTGWGNEVSKEELIKYNISYILTKPFRISELKKMIDFVIN